MNIPFIIIISDNVVDTVHQTTKENWQRDFLDYCSRNISNWAEYSQEDIDAILDEECAKYGNGSICLTWVDVTPETTNAGCDKCGTNDRIDGKNVCVHCEPKEFDSGLELSDFKWGMKVDTHVTPTSSFSQEFQGRVIDIYNGYVLVADQDDSVWSCLPKELTIVK